MNLYDDFHGMKIQNGFGDFKKPQSLRAFHHRKLCFLFRYFFLPEMFHENSVKHITNIVILLLHREGKKINNEYNEEVNASLSLPKHYINIHT